MEIFLVEAGETENGGLLFVDRAQHEATVTIGKSAFTWGLLHLLRRSGIGLRRVRSFGCLRFLDSS